VRQRNRRVFLSYSHDDRPFARLLANDLRKASIRLWMDELEILPGDSLIGKISAGVAGSDYVLACLSHSSVQSVWVRTELEIAATRGIREKRALVLPLLIDAVKLVEIPSFLSHLLFVDFRAPSAYDTALEQLMQQISPSQLLRIEGEIAIPLHRNVLAVDESRAQHLVTASSSGLGDWVASYLISVLKRPDPTERHWTYWALARIGGEAAEAALEKGLEDEDEFARLAVQKWKNDRDAAGINQ
jgi:hypothetical protein